MTKQVQRRRGTATQHTSFTGAEGELSVNTTNKSVHVHDNVTAGGFETARADMDNVTSSSILTAAGITATTAELNYVDGVTSAIQTQIDGKAGTASPTFTGTLTTANLTATGTTTLAGASTSADITFGDNDKAIFGGTTSELQIYSDGSNSYVTDQGTGSLRLRGVDIQMQNTSGVNYAKFVSGADVQLFYSGAPKLATTSTGVDVTGTLTSDGLTVDGVTYLNDADATAIASIGNLDPSESEFEFHNTDNSASYSGLRLRTRSAGASSWLMSNEWTASYKGDLVFRARDTSTTINQKLRLSNNGDISFYEDTGTTPKFFWDASAEQLVIGGSTSAGDAAADDLLVGQGSGNQGLTVYSGTSSTGNLFFKDSSSNFAGYVQYSHSDNSMRVGTATTEAMRINSDGSCRWTPDGTNPDMTLDASGNLLVGKTFSSSTEDGLELRSTNVAVFTRDGGNPLGLNRKTSDGDIIVFNKDGAPVGSIGTAGGRVYFADDATNGITFSSSSAIMWPSNSSGGVVDNTMDIGDDDFRFKDLYLSGGVYLGGTASANKLEDYEEGTFTPSFIGGVSNPTISYSQQTGVYTKIGRVVHASIMLAWTGKSGGSGQLRLGGLPFASNGQTRGVASISYNDNGLRGSNGNILLHTNASSNAIYFMVPDSEFQASTYLEADTGITTGAGYFQIAMTYQTS